MGLPGSGKSTLAKKVSEKYGHFLYDFDDHIPSFMKEKMLKGEIITEEDRLSCTKILIEDLKKVSSNRKVVCACTLIKENHRKLVLTELKHVIFYYLAVDYNVLLARLEKRNNHFFNRNLLERIIKMNEQFNIKHHIIDANRDESSVFSQFNQLFSLV